MTSIAQAVRILRAGALVAFPTETVYGLGADARNALAVGKIFAAKGRPATNPLIVHVADVRSARLYASHWDDRAARLVKRFWPGPLTIVAPRAASIVPQVSAGRDTVALRCPDHPLALELLSAFDGPIAAPSANRSTRVSPTTAEHVREELGDAVDLILDGGACRVGIESTVLDLSVAMPVLLRPGAVTRQQIESCIGPIEIFSGSVNASQAAASPGQQEIHYAPRCPAYRFETGQAQQVAEWRGQSEGSWAMLCVGPAQTMPSPLKNIPFTSSKVMLALAEGPAEYAHRLYAALRELDQPGIAALLVEMPPATPEWAAVNDRLRRATRPLSEILATAG